MNQKTKFPAGIYLLKVNNRNTRTRCEIYSKLTRKTPERRLASLNFEHISHLVLVFLLLTLNMQLPAGFRGFIFAAGYFRTMDTMNIMQLY